MKKLISMTDFVLEQNKDGLSHTRYSYRKCFEYAKFLKQPLMLGMFVPCDENGDVLTEPTLNDYRDEEGGNLELFKFNLENYKKAKEKVLFKGFEWDYEGECLKYKLSDSGVWFFDADDLENETMETFGGIENKIKLTESAIKQFS